jgi:hypothetical protein
MTATHSPDKPEKKKVSPVENHKIAAKHHEEAAKHHTAAAKAHEVGDSSKAHESTVKANGHHHLANKAQKKVAKTQAKSK